jgi:hypothetical protein
MKEKSSRLLSPEDIKGEPASQKYLVLLVNELLIQIMNIADLECVASVDLILNERVLKQ